MEEINDYDFKNVSKVSEVEARALHKAAVAKKMMWFCILCPTILIALGGLWCFIDLALGISLIFIGAVFGIAYPFFYKAFVEKAIKKQFSNYISYVTTFYFSETQIIVETERKISAQDESYQPLGKLNIAYSDIVKVIEDETYIYLFVTNSQAHVLNKNNMFKGEIPELKTLLKSKITNYKEVITKKANSKA